MTGFLRGSATALITPFTARGIDFPALASLIEAQVKGGTDALVVLGTTGEPATMTEEEKTAVLLFCKEKLAGRALLIAGAGANDTSAAVRAAERAERTGADGILAVTPYYNKCTQKGLIEYYRTISEATSLPIIVYNVPGRTGVNILPETMERIAEIKSVAGIKEASGNMAQVMETARLIRGKCDLYSGEDALNLPILCAGGAAVISVVSNLAPAGVKALVEAIFKGNLEEAIRLNDELLPLAKACFAEVNPIPVKMGAHLLGFGTGIPRAPLTPLEPEHAELLLSAMKKYGLQVKA